MSAAESRLQALLLAGLAGDADAYRRFLIELSAFVRAFLRRRLERMPGEVEDLVQEVLLAVHNQRHTYDAALPLTAWVHAIARYRLVDMLRRHAVREALHQPLPEDDSEAATLFTRPEHEAADAQRDVTALLAQLPEHQRLPILHVKIEGRSVAETAVLTGLSESGVKVGVHRGLRKLAALLRRPV